MILKNSKLRTLIWIFVFIVVFFLLASIYKEPLINGWDEWVMKHVSILHRAGLNSFFVFITNVASRPYQYALLTFFSIVWLFVERRWREPLVAAVCLIGIRIGNQWLKDLFQRERPSFDRIIEITGYSFPSGHAMISFAFFGILAYLLVQNYPVLQAYKKQVYGITGIFVLLVGFSRVYLGVHFPTDVLAGFSAGAAWLFICVMLYNFLKGNRETL
ncbi:phosphatase PAP2 family protein [Fictibacillus nanhaiensis]|uniref:phosphatase PAP2 family protein n=1 Tax=Fictibacillus nanhaiensis TaxID=742169 RepID=UPI001C942FCB|nr:phosphatase PAP2 family protein [Fictibacillus nanhaiensis]MBY6035587.1 phosphatase PAP2 family protein [Fictibacillus nanhaiensis]